MSFCSTGRNLLQLKTDILPNKKPLIYSKQTNGFFDTKYMDDMILDAMTFDTILI